MLHQLLLALLGKEGGVFRLEEFRMVVDPGVEFLSENEAESLNELVRLGFYFAKIQTRLRSDYSYARELHKAIREFLRAYEDQILGFERAFLQNRLFTFGAVKSDLFDYFTILPRLAAVLERIEQDQLRGGELLSYWDSERSRSSPLLLPLMDKGASALYSILHLQISNWVLYGKLVDRFDQFFIHRVSSQPTTESQSDWDTSFTFRPQMLPLSYVDKASAEKILFVGKGVRILRNLGGGRLLPEEQLVQLVESLKEYESSRFKVAVEQMRRIAARDLLEVVLNRKSLMKVLKELEDFYLMSKGEFYYFLLEECESIFDNPYNKTAERQLNLGPLQNTLARFGLRDSQLSFEIPLNGFVFDKYCDLSKLVVVGNMRKSANGYLVLNPEKSVGNSVFAGTKQAVENGFNSVLEFRFTHSSKERWNCNLNFVIQNCVDLNGVKKDTPTLLNQLSEFVLVRLISVVEKPGEPPRDELLIYAYNRQGQRQLGVRRVEVVPQTQQTLRVSYNSEEEVLQAVLNNREDYVVRTGLKLGRLIEMKSRKAYVGLISLSETTFIDLMSWKLVCNSQSPDQWTEISPLFKVGWPLTLLITPQVLDHYQSIFRLFFPVRKVLHELERVWAKLLKFCRANRLHSTSRVRSLLKLRNSLHHLISNIWIYFQSDVVAIAWQGLEEQVAKITDFEELRGLLFRYVRDISHDCFLAIPPIMESIKIIVDIARNFVKLLERWLREPGNVGLLEKANQCHDSFRVAFSKLFGLIHGCSRELNIRHLYQLLHRLDFNQYFKRVLSQ